jgi:uncharacterized protein with HEPN domain
MRRDVRSYLWDAIRAAEAAQAFVRGKTYEAFIEDDLVRSAVERQLQIVGEALSQLAKVDPQLASKVGELRRIIAFRNILVHGYAAVDYDTVWRLIEDKLPELQTNLRMLLRGFDPSREPPAGGPQR